ncbi:hypothetical protein HCG49_15605 [Arenibacter sp. 6A1]|uniref:hypothetical protein n=1 Tax=Arenibacter sp. 6A1 TaxID=2720391 RepID=UPI0014451F9B|nr:hypothetical protein [Arenibacter sp. 6A1]NKI27987.1 hypothetical protein [Arenibacter sp. 6A1]
MNKSIKIILVVAGTVLLGYGIYTFIVPETVVSIGSLDLIKAQNDNKAYIAIGLGLVILLLGLFKSK